MKLNDELASPRTESGCSITEKNGRHVADILQQGDWQEGKHPFYGGWISK
jgi:hypothetical protein